MPNIAKIVLIVLIAAIAIGAKHVASRSTQESTGDAPVLHAQISPEALTLAAGPLPETKIESYEWAHH